MKLLSLDVAQKTGVAYFSTEEKKITLFDVITQDRTPQDNLNLWNYLQDLVSDSDLTVIETLFIWTSRNIPNLIIQAQRNGYVLGKLAEYKYPFELAHVNKVRAFHEIKNKRVTRRTKKETPKECVNRLVNEQLNLKLSNDIADAIAQGLYILGLQIDNLEKWEVIGPKSVSL